MSLLGMFRAGSQNLVPDSSFELNKFVPLDFSALNASLSWSTPTRGTSDLFCKCDRKTKMLADKAYSFVDVPHNAMGSQYPNSGNCYAGIFAHSHGDYREYLQTPLSQPLQKDKTYLFSMYVSLSDYSATYVDQLGVCFQLQKSAFLTTEMLSGLNPRYIKIDEEVGDDAQDWHYVSTLYTALGGESYLVIGSFEINKLERTNFKPPGEVKTRINQTTGRDAYYYIDDVSVIEVQAEDPTEFTDADIDESMGADEIIPGDSLIILKNVLFETNETTLLNESFSELDLLATYMEQNPAYRLDIVGHTDNSGTEKANKELSVGRAKAVANYLVSRGMASSRISFTGYGSTRPVASNHSEEGKQQNRRVEIMVHR